MAALALAAVGGLRWETSIALAANHLLALVGGGEGSERGLNLDDTDTTATKSQDQVESGLLLNVVVRESAAVLKLLSGEDKTLLIGRNALLVLDLGPIRVKCALEKLDFTWEKLLTSRCRWCLRAPPPE